MMLLPHMYVSSNRGVHCPPRKEVPGLSASTDDWQENLRRLEEEIACSRQRRAELRQILDRLEQLNRQAESLTAPSPTPETRRSEAGPLPADGGTAPPDAATPPRDGPPGGTPGAAEGGSGEKAGWKARWRQAILERDPQAHLERTGALTAAVVGQMQALERSLEAAARFCDNLGSRLRTGETAAPLPAHLVKEVVTSEPFRLLAARLLADFLRETAVGPAHPGPTPILCSEAGHPQPTRKGKEVRTLKTQAPDPGHFWWIIIVILLIFLLLFFFPLGAGASQ
jgi:hypothetical protein